jgi:hypothetical protein
MGSTSPHFASTCLDRILILGRSRLEHVLRVYGRHDNEHRPHRAFNLLPPHRREPTPLNARAHLRRRNLLGGLIQNTKPPEFASPTGPGRSGPPR